ncbi:T-cell surface protein tactile [Scomber japonicus]|uniref:T-cell surface protein tactile n=1 Tax=Scomber japonicus TaxID=13676 RepID=UPI002306C6B1|nr:T-cell surface protein tactile [Scomber japonicus]
MNLGSSNMAGGALETAFSLLLLASIIQGLRDVDLFHNETVEAVVGQNISLPCIVKNSANIKVVNTEWGKRENEIKKLALYTPGFGVYRFRPNVSIQTVYNDAKNFMGSYLQLYEVEKENGGIYVCDVTTFPFGSIRVETVLKIKDVVRITCDANSTVEVQSGENVTIKCKVSPIAQYRWTKNEKLVSQSESLELWWVTSAHAGVYTLSINTGNETLHEMFNIIILATTTSSRRDLVTVSPWFDVTEGLNKSADSSLTTSQTTELSPTDTSVTSTIGVATGVTDNNPNNNLSNVTNTSFNNFHNLTTLSYGKTMLASDVTRNDMSSEESSTLGSNITHSSKPGATPTLITGSTTEAIEDNDTGRSHLLLVCIIVPILVLIAGILYRRHIIKKRMSEPPPFKPPPPPVRYTATRQRNKPPFPISRCNSVTELDMKQVSNI